MKTFSMIVLVLLSSQSVLGRKLPHNGCADLTALDAVPEVSDIVRLIKGFGLLPNGIPSNVTIFLPNNDAVQALIGTISPMVPALSVGNLPQMVASSMLASFNVTERIVSALLYHIAPVGAAKPDQLLAEESITTALEGFDLLFRETVSGTYTVTTASEEVADTSDPTLVCGSAVYVINKVMTPTNMLDPTFPLTSLPTAIAILGGGKA